MLNPKTNLFPGFVKASAIIVFSILTMVSLNAQIHKKQKVGKSVKADNLYKKALVLSDSAKYDSAIIVLTEASEIYEKKKDIEKYIQSKIEIVKQSRYLKFKNELLLPTSEIISLSRKELGNEHYITSDAYILLGNIFADNNNSDSALYYFNKAKAILELDINKNELRIASTNHYIGHQYTEKGEFEKASSFLHSALKTKIHLLGNKHPEIAALYNSLGRLQTKKGNIDSSAIYFDKMLEIRREYYGESHPIVADAYNNVGTVYKAKEDYEKALDYYKKALSIRKNYYKTLHPYLALSYSNIGVIYSDLGNYELSNQYYAKALEIRLKLFGKDHLDVAASYTNMGINCMYSGEVGSAVLYMQKVLKIVVNNYGSDNPNSANSYNNMGVAYVYALGDYDKALKYFIKALELRLKINANNPMLAGSYNNIGVVYRNRGEYELGLSYFKNELKILLDNFGEEHVDVATTYNNMGTAYLNLNELDTAKKYFDKALNIRIKIFGEDYHDLSGSYLNLGKVYNKLGDFEKEKKYYEKALEIYLKNFDKESVGVAKYYTSLGMNAVAMKDFPNAILSLNKALKIEQGTYSADHPDIAESLSKIGLVYSLSGNYIESNSYYLKSLDANYIGSITEQLEYNYVINEILYLETISQLADLNFNRFKLKGDIEFLKEAVSYYQKASNFVSYLVSDYYVEASKIELLKKASAIFEKALNAAEILYGINTEKRNIDLAFRFSEQNKSSVLYESIVRSNVDIETISDSLWIAQKDLLGKIDHFKTQLIEKESNARNGKIKNEIDAELSKSIVDYQRVSGEIRSKEATKKFVLFHNKSIIDTIQKELKPNELMLEYFVTDSAIYCFVIGKDLLKLKRINVEPDFNDKIISYISIIKKHRFGQFQEDSYYLYDKLIKPVEGYFTNKTRLIIIPDGQLLYLPFGSLISKKQNFTGDVDFSKLDYLIKKYEIVTQYSANLWLESFLYAKKSNLVNGFIGLAPFSGNETIAQQIDSTNMSFLDRSLPEDLVSGLMNNNNEFKSLPYSGKEVNEIAQLFESQGINTKSLLGTDATEQKLKDNSKQYKYLHIATHGIINNIHPELSGLAFIKDKNEIPKNNHEADWQIGQNTDGILYAKEIYDLDLNAELVVLSACETGIGKLEKGEGIMSLTRGFLYNKVPNIVFSLWKINDKNTCSLMLRFYENMLKDESYSSALRNAKLDMISNEATAFPVSWAGFSLIGQ